MPKIVPIVEGDGELDAVPVILRRILYENFQVFDWEIGRPKKAHSLPAFRQKLSNFIQYAQMEPAATHILIVIDLDDGCPKEEVRRLTEEIRQTNPKIPVLVVLAHREYEAWFLASMSSLAGKDNLPQNAFFEGDVEGIRGVKEWLTRQMPPGKTYKETTHQPAWSATMDIGAATLERSRSFRRLVHAVEEILTRPASPVFVSPAMSNE